MFSVNSFIAAISFLRACGLAKGHARHLVLFPEGTRYDDGEIHEFHSGFALLATKLGRPILPICMQGMNEFMPKGTILINPGAAKLKIVVGEPIYCGQDETIDAFTVRVHEWFCKTIKSC